MHKKTNAEVIIQALKNIEDDEIAESVAEYINCPSCVGCKYDGADNSVCEECKITWLRGKWED